MNDLNRLVVFTASFAPLKLHHHLLIVLFLQTISGLRVHAQLLPRGNQPDVSPF